MRAWINLFEKAWHGSPNAARIDALRPSLGGELGPGLYFSRDYRTAAGYAIPSGEDAVSAYSGVLELDLDALNIKTIARQEWLDRRAQLMDQFQAANGGDWKGEFYNLAMAQMIDEYEAEGFDGLYDDWNQGIVFPDRVDRVRIVRGT